MLNPRVSGSTESVRGFNLTSREMEIIAAVLSGYSDQHIARKLSTTKAAVGEEMAALSHRLGVEGRLELALFALHHGLAG